MRYCSLLLSCGLTKYVSLYTPEPVSAVSAAPPLTFQNASRPGSSKPLPSKPSGTIVPPNRLLSGRSSVVSKVKSSVVCADALDAATAPQAATAAATTERDRKDLQFIITSSESLASDRKNAVRRTGRDTPEPRASTVARDRRATFDPRAPIRTPPPASVNGEHTKRRRIYYTLASCFAQGSTSSVRCLQHHVETLVPSCPPHGHVPRRRR